MKTFTKSFFKWINSLNFVWWNGELFLGPVHCSMLLALYNSDWKKNTQKLFKYEIDSQRLNLIINHFIFITCPNASISCNVFSSLAFVVSNALVSSVFCSTNLTFWAFRTWYLVVHSSTCCSNSNNFRFFAGTDFAVNDGGTFLWPKSLHAYGNISYRCRSSIFVFNTVSGWAYQNVPNFAVKLAMYVFTSCVQPKGNESFKR